MSSSCGRSQRFFLSTWALVAALACSFLASAVPANNDTAPATSVTGSGVPYKTKVEREVEGELASEDLQQVSLLGARIVKHLNKASEELLDEEIESAKTELDKASTLTGLIRELLPVTIVKTVVEDALGQVVYESTDRVQDDQIPIFEHQVAVEVMEPVLDAKKEAAAVKGVRLADADLIHTSVLLDLGYVERKVKRSLTLLDDRDKALAQLVLAQSRGVRLSLNREDHPLVEAQSALRLAQRMVEQERFDAAKANLTLARNHLELYRGLIGKSSDRKVNQLDTELASVLDAIEAPDAGDKIGGFWDRLTGWFKEESGQVRATETPKPQVADN